MADYAKMKNVELENLLKERGLPHSGKKAELIKRLQDHDSEKAGADAPAASKNEDEIDWDDEPTTTEAAPAATEPTAATSAPAAAVVAESGNEQTTDAPAAPKQDAAIETTETKESAPAEPAAEAVPATESEPAAEAAPTEEKAKTPVDFTAGIAQATLDKEIEKRKARAKKFGIDESSDETLKALERSKRFGGTDLPGRLNEALPEKREKKRGREAPEDNASRKKTRQGPGGRKDNERRNVGRAAPAEKKTGGRSGTWMSEADKAKAEARKAKFASAT